MAIFDSMSNQQTFQEVCDVLQRWLAKVYKLSLAKLNICRVHVKVSIFAFFLVFYLIVPWVSQLKNYHDCGPFVVHFVQTFFSDAAAYSKHILVSTILWLDCLLPNSFLTAWRSQICRDQWAVEGWESPFVTITLVWVYLRCRNGAAVILSCKYFYLLLFDIWTILQHSDITKAWTIMWPVFIW